MSTETQQEPILRASVEARHAFAKTFERIADDLKHGNFARLAPLGEDDAHTATLKGLADLYFQEVNTRLPRRIIVALCECAMFENAKLLAEQARLRAEAKETEKETDG